MSSIMGGPRDKEFGLLGGDGATGSSSGAPRNRIQVSREKKPLNFFINLTKKFLQNEEEVELSGMGLAVTSAVTVAEILKSQGVVEIQRIATSLVDTPQDQGPSVPKAKIQIWVTRGGKFKHSGGSSSDHGELNQS